MKKLLVFLLASIPYLVTAQYLEIGASVGGGNYVGELSANSSTLFMNQTNLAVGGFARYNINHLLAVKLHGQYTKLSGTDTNAKSRFIVDRNLSFQTNILEAGITGEFNILGFDPQAGSFSPYLFGGIAFFKFNPETVVDGSTYALQPLGTEGQGLAEYPNRVPYELNQLAIPFGLGVKYTLTENIQIGIEVGGRKLFTDYLDDVSLTYPDPQAFNRDDPNALLASQLSNRSLSGDSKTGQGRGDTKSADSYFIANFTISYNFLDSGTIGGRRGSRKSKMGCPTF